MAGACSNLIGYDKWVKWETSMKKKTLGRHKPK
jgi:hypothetical protein